MSVNQGSCVGAARKVLNDSGPRAQHFNHCFLDIVNQSWRYISFILWLTNMAYDSSSKRRRRAGAILFCFCFCLSIIA